MEITDEQKREIKTFIQAQADQFTDFASMLYETLGLATPPCNCDSPQDGSKYHTLGCNLSGEVNE